MLKLAELLERCGDAEAFGVRARHYRKEILAALRAVNSHAGLVAALEAAEEYISVDTDIPAADAVLAQIRIALAKAK